ncbi:MAG: Holliday junction branch migration protein RuvA [Alphaproteobacteria bacterium]
MIAHLAGEVSALLDEALVLDVNGVGYLVFCPTSVVAGLSVGEPAKLWILTHVREDHIHLYGFRDLVEREWFTALQSVQGVGAKVALALLSVMRPDELGASVAAQDKTLLTRAPGVGPRLAQRIVAELKDRAPTALTISTAPPTAGAPVAGGGNASDAVSALVNLGYRQPEALQAVQKALRADADADVSALIRAGLGELAR